MIYVTNTITCTSDGLTSTTTLASGYTSFDEVAKRLQHRVLLGWQKCGQYAITCRSHWAGEECVETVEYHEVQE